MAEVQNTRETLEQNLVSSDRYLSGALLEILVSIVFLSVAEGPNPLRLYIGIRIGRQVIHISKYAYPNIYQWLTSRAKWFVNLFSLTVMAWNIVGAVWLFQNNCDFQQPICLYSGLLSVMYVFEPGFGLLSIVWTALLILLLSFCELCSSPFHSFRRKRQMARVLSSLQQSIVNLQGGTPEPCVVCLSEMNNGETIRTLPCNHSYHKDCIDPWILEHQSCPMCREQIRT